MALWSWGQVWNLNFTIIFPYGTIRAFTLLSMFRSLRSLDRRVQSFSSVRPSSVKNYQSQAGSLKLLPLYNPASFRSGSCGEFGSGWADPVASAADPVDNLAVAERILCSGSWWACGSCVNFELSGSCFSGSCCADPAERILVSGSYERIRRCGS